MWPWVMKVVYILHTRLFVFEIERCIFFTIMHAFCRKRIYKIANIFCTFEAVFLDITKTADLSHKKFALFNIFVFFFLL